MLFVRVPQEDSAAVAGLSYRKIARLIIFTSKKNATEEYYEKKTIIELL